MTGSESEFRRRELLWTSVTVGAFSVTGWTYFNVGFVPSILPFLVGVFSLRRLLALGMAKKEQTPDLSERYDVDSNREYTAAEQIEVLSEVASEYGRKRRTWVILGVLSAIVSAVAVPVSLALSLVCAAVAGYCVVRYARIRRLLRRIDARIDALERG